MTRGKVEQLRDLYAHWAEGDFTAGAELLAADVVFDSAAPGQVPVAGREALSRQMREFLSQWSTFRIEAVDFEDLGDAVLVTERQVGVGKSSGVETEATFYALWSFRDGSVSGIKWHTERASALEGEG